jgi:hypothetical protein
MTDRPQGVVRVSIQLADDANNASFAETTLRLDFDAPRARVTHRHFRLSPVSRSFALRPGIRPRRDLS